MRQGTIVPCLWLDDQAESAAAFYSRIFPRSRTLAVSHYPTASDNPAGRPPGSILTVEAELAGQRFTLLNGGPQFTINPSISFFVHTDTPEEADRTFSALADGGEVLMPLGSYPWSERFGWVKDRFGVSWQVIAGQRDEGGATIVPCLMFSDAQRGRAWEAIETYVHIFPWGRVGRIERFEANEGPEGTIKHGRFVLDGQEMVAMDSPIDHGFGFNEAVSLQVMCKDQGEVDLFWEALSSGGERGPCGWVRDRFGLSWQVVPDAIASWLNSPDVDARDRAFAAMMQMGKPDIAALQAAFEGR